MHVFFFDYDGGRMVGEWHGGGIDTFVGGCRRYGQPGIRRLTTLLPLILLVGCQVIPRKTGGGSAARPGGTAANPAGCRR